MTQSSHPKSHWQMIWFDARPPVSQKNSGPAFPRLRDDLLEARSEDQTSVYQPFISTYCVPGTVLIYSTILCNNYSPQNNPGRQAGEEIKSLKEDHIARSCPGGRVSGHRCRFQTQVWASDQHLMLLFPT